MTEMQHLVLRDNLYILQHRQCTLPILVQVHVYNTHLYVSTKLFHSRHIQKKTTCLVYLYVCMHMYIDLSVFLHAVYAESTGREESSEMNVAPVQESSQGAATNASPTKATEIELMRQKRLKKLLSNDSSQSSPKHDVSSEGVSRSMSDPSSSAGSGEHATTDSPKAKRLPTFEVGDVVKVELALQPRPWYGVIRWIGSIKNSLDKVAGIEMVSKAHTCHHRSGDFFNTCTIMVSKAHVHYIAHMY